MQCKLRYDLEFYSPQLISHFLRQDLTEFEEAQIRDLIVKACQTNIFFAHKIWFNLKASLVNKDNRSQALKILSLLSEIEVLTSKNSEKLYIANSETLIKLIMKTDLSQLLDKECLEICHDQSDIISNKKNQRSPGRGDEQSRGEYFLSLFSR